jgi:hypothetical protein
MRGECEFSIAWLELASGKFLAFSGCMLILSLVSARRQYLAGRVSAGRTGICNETLRSREWLNPGHLRHRGFTPWTACCVLARDIRHNQPQRSTIPTLKRANDRGFPLYRQKVRSRFFAAMPIRPYLEGHRFDAETTRLMGIAFETAVATLSRPAIQSPVSSSIWRKPASATPSVYARRP